MVHNLHSIVDLIEGIIEFSLSDNKRRSDVKNWSTYPHEDTVLKELLLELDNSRRVRVLEESLDQLAILSDEVKCTEKTSEATLSEAIVLSQEFLHAFVHDLLHLLDVANNILLDHILHGLIASNAADRMSLIGCSPTNGVSPVEILYVFSESYCRQG